MSVCEPPCVRQGPSIRAAALGDLHETLCSGHAGSGIRLALHGQMPARSQAPPRAAVFARANHEPRTADSSPPTPPLCILPSSGVMIQWQPFKFPYRQSKNAGCLDELKLVSPSPVKSFIIITPAKHSILNPFSSRIFLSLSTEASIPA